MLDVRERLRREFGGFKACNQFFIGHLRPPADGVQNKKGHGVGRGPSTFHAGCPARTPIIVARAGPWSALVYALTVSDTGVCMPAEHFLGGGLVVRHRRGPRAPGLRVDPVAVVAELLQARLVLVGQHLPGKRLEVS